MLVSIIVKFVLYLSCKKNENKQKESGFGPFLKIVPCLRFSSFELIKEEFRFRSDVQLGVVVDEEDEIGVIDEPLARVVEWIKTVNFASASGLEDARNFGERSLKWRKEVTFYARKLRLLCRNIGNFLVNATLEL